MSVSLYDLLDVDEDATPAQIRTAWKAAIADLDPTDRRFRAFNDAAGVLLDADKRAAYDAELAAGRTEAEVDEAPAEDGRGRGARAEDEGRKPSRRPTSAEDDEDDEPAAAVPVAARVTDRGLRRSADLGARSSPSAPPSCRSRSLVVVLTWPGTVGGESPADQEEQRGGGGGRRHHRRARRRGRDPGRPRPTTTGPSTRTSPRRESYLTDEFAAKRTALFEQKADSGMTLREQVVDDKVVVVAAVSADRTHPGVRGRRPGDGRRLRRPGQPEGQVRAAVAADVGDAEHGRRRRRLAPRRHLHRGRLRLTPVPGRRERPAAPY